jgi:hypothetical protein
LIAGSYVSFTTSAAELYNLSSSNSFATAATTAFCREAVGLASPASSETTAYGAINIGFFSASA